MAQKAQHHFEDDYHMNAVGTSSNQSGWIWAGLAAIAILGLAVWFLSATSPTTSTVTSTPPQTEQIAPPAEAPAPTPAPAPDAAPAPAQDAAPAPAPAPTQQ
jgi:hypothetical protein